MSNSPHSPTPDIGRDRNIAIVLIVIFIVSASVPWLYAQPWTGFGPVTTTSTTVEDQSSGVTTTTTTQTQPAKTLWDWSVLLVIPLVLGAAAIWFNWTERQNERRIADQRAKIEHEIAADRLEEEMLQGYLDRMSDLLIHEGLAGSDEKSPVRDVARARTLTTLRRLNGERKGAVIRFLFESDLIGRKNIASLTDNPKFDQNRPIAPVISMRHADLSKVSLVKASLFGATLDQTDLSEADLTECILLATGLMDANLRGATLRHASLGYSMLSRADLTGADLRNATLINTKLSYAKLENAQVTMEQLAKSKSLYGAIMPSGIVYDGQFNLPGDIESAKTSGIDVEDSEAMRRWYTKEH